MCPRKTLRRSFGKAAFGSLVLLAALAAAVTELVQCRRDYHRMRIDRARRA